jgi:hypothetical protein
MAIAVTDIATQVVKALANNAAVTATADGSEIDLSDVVGPLTLTLHIGAVTGTSPTLGVALKTAPVSGGTFATSPEGTLFSLVAADANTVKTVTLPQTVNGFVKISFTAGGTSPSFTLSALAFGQKHISGTGGQGYSLTPTTAY